MAQASSKLTSRYTKHSYSNGFFTKSRPTMVLTSRAQALLVASVVAAASVLLVLSVTYTVYDAAGHRRVVLMLDEEGHHEQVATGLPRTYDGRWGEQFHRNAGGHEGPFREAHLNYDDYPADIYRGVPFIPFDPAVAHPRDLSQKIFPPREMARSHIQQSGANAGGEVWPVGWGVWNAGRPSGDRLRSHGIKVDQWPIDLYHGFPNPAWDESEHHAHRNVYRMPAEDAHEVADRQHKSEEKLKAAGVHVSGMPWDTKKHAYNNVDGLLDHLVDNQPAPQYRKEGLTRTEHPYHFLLDEHPEVDQREEINRMFRSGDLDHERARAENAEEGYEEDSEDEALPEMYREQREEEEEHAEEEAGEGEEEEGPSDTTADVYESVPREYRSRPYRA